MYTTKYLIRYRRWDAINNNYMFRPSGGNHQVVHSEVDSWYNVYTTKYLIRYRRWDAINNNYMFRSSGGHHQVVHSEVDS